MKALGLFFIVMEVEIRAQLTKIRAQIEIMRA